VAVNPHTPIALLKDVIEETDLVCMMSVNPGFGGQKFIENTYTKVAELKQLISERRSSALIEIDGGVNQDNARPLLEAGAHVLVAGNFVFSAANPKEVIQRLKAIRKTELA
jgi:ribulose-phosphate 3-epimerase